MNNRSVRPAWWELYLIVIAGLGLLALVCGASLSETWEEVIDCGLLLLLYGAVMLWLRANRSALLQSSHNDVEKRAAGQPLESPAGKAR